MQRSRDMSTTTGPGSQPVTTGTGAGGFSADWLMGGSLFAKSAGLDADVLVHYLQL